jgi:hypothetical protein
LRSNSSVIFDSDIFLSRRKFFFVFLLLIAPARRFFLKNCFYLPGPVSAEIWSPVLLPPPLDVSKYLWQAIVDGTLAEGTWRGARPWFTNPAERLLGVPGPAVVWSK